MVIYPITPCTKPRMTQRDKWKKRPRVLKYFAFRDEVKLRGVEYPESGAHIIFHIPLPKSRTKKKRALMDGKPHQQVPDKDNLDKVLMDAAYDNDCRVWDSRVTRLWAFKGAREIKAML